MKDYRRLLSIIKSLDSVLVAYSGGVDSSLLLKAVKDAEIRAFAVTIISELTPMDEIASASEGLKEASIGHRLEYISLLGESSILKNPRERCYYCKDIIMARLCLFAKAMGLDWVIEGSNADDHKVWRPGIKALEKHKVRSPLFETGLDKEGVRLISKNLGLAAWNRPSSPCLATRFYYDIELTQEGLKRVDESEAYIRGKGFYNVRVRTDGFRASVEVDPSQLFMLQSGENKEDIIDNLMQRGFLAVSIDMEGYSSGKLDKL